MNKFIFVFVVVIGVAFASVGFVDTLQVLQSYNKAIAAQADLVQKQMDVQDFFVLKQKEYEGYISPDSSDEEVAQIMKELEQELELKKQELMDLNKSLSGEIEQDILEITEKVADDFGLDVVVDKKTILAGGIDLTDIVIKELNKTIK